jgi:hypothetical protein
MGRAGDGYRALGVPSPQPLFLAPQSEAIHGLSPHPEGEELVLLGFAVVGAHGALFFALPVAFFFGVALIVFLLAASEADFHFDLVAFPVDGDGYEGVALAFDGANELIDFLFVQKQLARAPIRRDHVRGRADEWGDGGADQEDLALQYHGITVAEVDAAGAQCLHLPSLQGNACLVTLVDVVFMPGALVERDGATRILFVFVLCFCHVR